jgi:hypothetical protein
VAAFTATVRRASARSQRASRRLTAAYIDAVRGLPTLAVLGARADVGARLASWPRTTAPGWRPSLTTRPAFISAEVLLMYFQPVEALALVTDCAALKTLANHHPLRGPSEPSDLGGSLLGELPFLDGQ